MPIKSTQSQSFYDLTPDTVLAAVEDAGFFPTGEFQQLNSYENRVFDIRFEEEPKRLISKFYRPSRWSREAIQDEHDFLLELKDEGVAAIAPLKIDGETIFEENGIFFSLFPRFAGRMPQEFLPGELKQVGRTLARIHNIGAQKEALHRPDIFEESFWDKLDLLERLVDPSVWPRYEKAVSELLEYLEDTLDPSTYIRIHGDCHRGNLLHNGEEFFFVDFDDFVNGPPAQDFWMLLSGAEDEQREEILTGYEELRDFDRSQLDLLEPLRALRIFNYAHWIAQRWEDPSFPKIFPDFGSFHYWAEEVESLEKVVWNLS